MAADVKKVKKGKAVAVTVICVDATSVSIPRKKAKLKSDEKTKLCIISPTDSNEEVSSKINKLFVKNVKMLRPTKSGDLFDIEENLNGEDLLELIGSGCLYVKPVADRPSAEVQPLMKEG